MIHGQTITKFEKFVSNFSVDIKTKFIRRCIWSVAVYGSETWTLEKNEERVVTEFETWRWRTMLKIKGTDRVMNDEVFQRAKEERLLLKILKNRRHSWIWQKLSITGL